MFDGVGRDSLSGLRTELKLVVSLMVSRRAIETRRRMDGTKERGGRTRAHFGVQVSACFDGATSRLESLSSSEGVLEEHKRKNERSAHRGRRGNDSLFPSSSTLLDLPAVATRPSPVKSTSLLSLSTQRLESWTRRWMRLSAIQWYSSRPIKMELQRWEAISHLPPAKRAPPSVPSSSLSPSRFDTQTSRKDIKKNQLTW